LINFIIAYFYALTMLIKIIVLKKSKGKLRESSPFWGAGDENAGFFFALV